MTPLKFLFFHHLFFHQLVELSQRTLFVRCLTIFWSLFFFVQFLFHRFFFLNSIDTFCLFSSQIQFFCFRIAMWKHWRLHTTNKVGKKSNCKCFLRDYFQVTEQNKQERKTKLQKSWMLLMCTFLPKVFVLNIFSKNVWRFLYGFLSVHTLFAMSAQYKFYAKLSTVLCVSIERTSEKCVKNNSNKNCKHQRLFLP